MNSPYLTTADARQLETLVLEIGEGRHSLAGVGGDPVAISIFDATGRRLSSYCPEALRISCISHADNKALTALRFQRDTVMFCHDFPDPGAEWIKDPEKFNDGAVACAAATHPNFCHYAGGLLIKVEDGRVLGAIGVSGRAELEDHQLGVYALSNFYMTFRA
jgi:uncharacterized protein GlcG (DUF336 family)